MTDGRNESEASVPNSYLNFPKVDRREFKNNYLDTVVLELRYPTYLRLKKMEPVEISEAIRERFPHYSHKHQMQMTPLGTTDPQPVYQFVTRKKDFVLDLSASEISLSTRTYRSFEVMYEYAKFIIETCIPLLQTNFFTRVGLRYINTVSGMDVTGRDVFNWINNDLVCPVGRDEIGTINNIKNELTGSLEFGGNYTFRYGLSPPEVDGARKFVLDWDYSREDVEVDQSLELLNKFHDVHFGFFWWALGEKAKEALNNGTARS